MGEGFNRKGYSSKNLQALDEEECM
jgi:hypothetical protein